MMTLMVDLIILCLLLTAHLMGKGQVQEVQAQEEMKEDENFLCFTFHTRVL